MAIRFLPRNPETEIGGLHDVIEKAVEETGEIPAWVGVDDASRACIPLMAARPASERSHSIVATADDGTLLAAHRLGVGGALVLPPSSLGASEAVRAAARDPVPAPAFDAGAVDIFGDSETALVVGFSRRSFWRVQLGDRVLSRMLLDLAVALGVAPAVLPWPAAVVAGPGRDEILEAWKPLASGAGRPLEDLIVLEIRPHRGEILAAAYRALVDHESDPGPSETTAFEPVYELPGGALVGWWGIEGGDRRRDGWVAVPGNLAGLRSSWNLEGPDGAAVIEDVMSVAEIEAMAGAAAVRVPGWLSDNLRPGTPAGLLVQRVAEAAARVGLALWIPNVDGDALRFALRLPGRVWVDGPAVPRR